MHMVAPAKVWTAEEVLALPYDGRRIELIDGVLLVNGVEVPGGDLGHLDPAMTPAPSWPHQNLVLELARRLAAYVERHAVGHVMAAPAGVPLAPGQVVEPDLFVVPLVGGRRPRSWDEAGGLLLVVEVLSPSTARRDRGRKRMLYQRAGVPDYWILDLDERRIERWKPGSDVGEILTTTIEWTAPGATEPLRIDIPDLFSRALD